MKKQLSTIAISICLLAGGVLAYIYIPGFPSDAQAAARRSSLKIEPLSKVAITVFSNDSVADLVMTGQGIESAVWDSLLVNATQYSVDVFSQGNGCLQILWDSLMYTQRWDTLKQAIFWRQVMRMPKDSCLVSLAADRTIFSKMSLRDWEALGDSLKEEYKDSLRLASGLPTDAPIYVTPGKSHYYAFDKVLPSIAKGIQIFKILGVDPWYAQAILLIESPGKLQYSPVGAYGSFQLMEEVALEQGLVVNDSIDEREDFPKAAQGAAGLLAERCIPQTRHILRKRNIPFNESELWFRLLVLHSYHAGAGNVEGVMKQIEPETGGMALMQRIWQTEYGGFKNASQNYSQVALASLMELDALMAALPDSLCQERLDAFAFAPDHSTPKPVVAPDPPKAQVFEIPTLDDEQEGTPEE
ncbi:MAG: transglycosylase SLT domain-containing protein [Bacteroidota bacterium]